MILERQGVLRRFKFRIEHARIEPLLIFLGCPRKMVYTRRKCSPKYNKTNLHFWRRYENQIDAVFRDCRQYYVDKLKSCHPDLHGGSSERAALVNQVWSRVKQLFIRRGASLD